MESWKPLRGTIYEPEFDAHIAGIGVGYERFDDVWEGIQEVFAGATLEKLDEVYPEYVAGSGMRLVLTEAAPGVPPLRVIVRFPHPEDDKVHLVDVDLLDDPYGEPF